ncbi:MAG: insulinase family protein [Kiritimatiellaeota bacterium]|nr:insulinase family protein [Kiritimatiellota bacterium]
MKNIQITVLRNGATVATSAVDDAESVAFGVWAKVGGRYEKAAQSGMSHFLEHMLFKGTPTRSALQISQAIEGCGGYLNAFTQEESTCYYARLPHEFMPRAVEVLTDMYVNASVKQDDLERERAVIIEEIKMYQDQPQSVVQEQLQDTMFVSHALGRPLAGSEKTLMPVDRTVMLDFKARAYVPSATVFAFAGRLQHEACVACVEKAFGDVAKRKGLSYPPVTGATNQRPFVMARKDIAQVHAVAGFRIFGRHDSRRYALRVLNGLLGENMSSRLFQSVRERHGLCYSISSSYQLFDETGMFTISGGFDTQRAEAALRLTAKEVRRVIDKNVSAQELKRTKDYLLGTFRLGLEGTGSQMLLIGESLLHFGRVMLPAETIRGIQAVTADDVQRVAADVFAPERMTLSLVVPNAQPQDETAWRDTFAVL